MNVYENGMIHLIVSLFSLIFFAVTFNKMFKIWSDRKNVN